MVSRKPYPPPAGIAVLVSELRTGGGAVRRSTATGRATAARLSDPNETSVIRFGFLCECADKRCTQAIAMTADEYETVRADPLAFAVAPGHEVPSIEQLE
jgi:hypothetical protein